MKPLVYKATQSADSPLKIAMETVKLWQRRIYERRQLASLDSRLLADAGISEAQRQLELSKPFWKS